MGIRSTFLPFQLSSKHCADNESECTEYERVKDELNKEFERSLGNYTPNPSNGQHSSIVAERRSNIPRTKVVHLTDTSVHFATVMRSVRLELATCRTIWWPPIGLTDKHVLGVEALKAPRVQGVRLPPSGIIQPPFDIRVHVISIGLLSCPPTWPTAPPPPVFAMTSVWRSGSIIILIFNGRRAPRKEAGVPGDIVKKP